MDITTLLQNILSEKLGQSFDTNSITNALAALVGNENGEFSIQDLLKKLSSVENLSDLASSFFSGENNFDVNNIFNSEDIQNFASKLNIDSNDATNVLNDVLPKITNNISNDKIEEGLNMLKNLF